MTLEQRVGLLGKYCRNLTSVLVATVAVMMVIFFGGAGPNAEPAYLQAREFEILDGSGTVRSRIGKVGEGYGVVVCGANDQQWVTLTDVPCGVWQIGRAHV